MTTTPAIWKAEFTANIGATAGLQSDTQTIGIHSPVRSNADCWLRLVNATIVCFREPSSRPQPFCVLTRRSEHPEDWLVLGERI